MFYDKRLGWYDPDSIDADNYVATRDKNKKKEK